MRKFFYSRLALQNIRKNGKFYFPYLLAFLGCVCGMYLILSLSTGDGIANLRGGEYVAGFMTFGTGIVGLFAAIFLFYTNSFLIKRRKRELGLYNILGMEKRHIAKVLFLESFFIAFAGIVIGLGLGVALDKLMILLVSVIIQSDVPFGFSISWTGILTCLLLFGAIWICTLVYNLARIQLSKPVELLRSENVGEREPKTRWLVTIFGILCLGAGYAMAVLITDPIASMALYFVAVILVVIGTYCLFIGVSVFVLKALRKWKRFYYKPNHFINVSGMIYRMKQNGVGLANICILSTMVLVAVSTTVSLYLGIQGGLSGKDFTIYPYSTVYSALSADSMEEIAQDAAQKQGLSVSEFEGGISLDVTVSLNNDSEFIFDLGPYEPNILVLLTQEDYNRSAQQPVSLAPGEALVYEQISGQNYGDDLKDNFSIGGLTFTKTGDMVLPNYLQEKYGAFAYPVYYVVVDSFDTLEQVNQMQIAAYQEQASIYQGYYLFNTGGTEEQQMAILNSLWDDGYAKMTSDSHAASEEWSGGFRASNLLSDRADAYALFGGFLFLGLFIGILFTLAAVLIIYYKQLSEGYEDQHRYEILQKVGMSRKEVKKTIRSQVLMVFFLPLIVTAIHLAFNFNIMNRILDLMDSGTASQFAGDTFLFTTIITLAAFCVIYTLVYLITSKAYLRIVSPKKR